MRTFEDFAPGQVYALGERTVSRDEIIAFATAYDPQPFHTDEQAAAGSVFGGLVASGWHTAAIFMRLYADALLADAASMGSPGVEELRWRAPVRPGDTLRGSFRVLDVAPSTRRADRGTVFFEAALHNQDDVAVMTLRARGYFARRVSA